MENDYLDRIDRMQRLNKNVQVEYKGNTIAGAVWFFIFVAMIIAVLGFVVVGVKHTFRKDGQLDCSACHNAQFQKHEKLTEYFKKNGSKTPEEMANAVLKTKSPRLLSAMAVRETNGNPSVRASGYRKRHDGAFQVSRKHWGKVPHDAVGQALQAENILTELTQENKGNITKALNSYGGDSHGKYARTILAELVNVP